MGIGKGKELNDFKHIENLLADLEDDNEKGTLTEEQKNMIKAACGEEERKIIVHTPLGDIVAYASTDPFYPGIYVDFISKADTERNGRSAALVEYTPNEENPDASAMRVLVWGDKGNISDCEDYTKAVSFYTQEDADKWPK